jgi:hypothetical protein
MIKLHHDGLSRPLESPRLRVLSLGAGVQSTTLALMAGRGEIELPDFAIFADTGDEPEKVYRHLDWLEQELPFPVRRVSAGKSISDAIREGKGLRIPAFAAMDDGRPAPVTRTCTRDFKIDVINAEVRRTLGVKPRQPMRSFLGLKRGDAVPPVVEQWLGISMDEIERLKRGRLPWVHIRHPLIEARMNRRDCLRWLEERQYPIPMKSACVFCPWRTNAEWRELRDHHPADFARAVRSDADLRAGGPRRSMRTLAYVHRTMVPLDQVDLSAPEEGGFDFRNECDGVCGV